MEVPSPLRRGLGRGQFKSPPHPNLLPEGEGTPNIFLKIFKIQFMHY